MDRERIIVGVDELEASLVAVDWVIERARSRPLDVELLRVADLLMADQDDGRELLEATADRIRAEAPGTLVVNAVSESEIVRTLLAASEDHDLLVLGSHRARHVSSILTGALPYRLAAASSCPTVIVPDDWDREATGPVVVGVSEGEDSDAAVETAVREAETLAAPLVLVHAWMPIVVGADYVDPQLAVDTVRLQRARVLEEAAAAVSTAHPQLELAAVFESGPVVDVLARAAEGARLVVIGTRHRGPVGALLLGSTGLGMTGRTRAPLLIAPVRRATAAARPRRG